MKIGSLNNFLGNDLLPELSAPKTGEGVFEGLIKNVMETQNTAEQSMQDFMSGKKTEIHEVMIAGEQAKTSLELLVEIRNKAVDMYKELTRIQV